MGYREEDEDVILIITFIVSVMAIIMTFLIRNISDEMLAELGKYAFVAVSIAISVGIPCLVAEIVNRRKTDAEKYRTLKRDGNIVSVVAILGIFIISPFIMIFIEDDWLKDFGIVAIVMLSIYIPYVVWRFFKM